MLNIVRMDLRRLVRTRSLYAILLVLAAMLLITSFSTWYMTEKSMTDLMLFAQEQLEEENISATSEMGQIGLAASLLDASDSRVMQLQVRRAMSFGVLASMPFTGFLAHTLLAVLTALYASKDYATGYFKNLLALPGVKTKWFISKVLMLALCILIVVAAVLGLAAIGTLILGNPMEIDWPQITAFMGQHMLLSFGLNMLVLLILVLSQNKTAALTMGILLSVNTQNLLFLLLDTTDWLPFRLRDWGLMNQAMKITMGGAMPERLPVIAAAVIGISFLVSLLAINRRDLKM